MKLIILSLFAQLSVITQAKTLENITPEQTSVYQSQAEKQVDIFLSMPEEVRRGILSESAEVTVYYCLQPPQSPIELYELLYRVSKIPKEGQYSALYREYFNDQRQLIAEALNSLKKNSDEDYQNKVRRELLETSRSMMYLPKYKEISRELESIDYLYYLGSCYSQAALVENFSIFKLKYESFYAFLNYFYLTYNKASFHSFISKNPEFSDRSIEELRLIQVFLQKGINEQIKKAVLRKKRIDDLGDNQ